MNKEDQERLGISDETVEAMKEFFLKTSLPRIIERRRREGTLDEIRGDAK